MPDNYTRFAPLEEAADEMTESEYAVFLDRLTRKGYLNHASKGEDGKPIDANQYILAGLDILLEVMTGD